MNCRIRPTKYVHAEKPHYRLHQCTRAECSNAIWLTDGKRPGRIACRHPHVGAGDVVAMVANSLGIKPWQGCKCSQIRDLMNLVMPAIRKPWFVSWWQGVKKQLPKAVVVIGCKSLQ